MIYQTRANFPLDETCSPPVSLGGTGNCGPSFCSAAAVSTRGCSFNIGPINYAQRVSANRCKVCTQAVDDRCYSSSLYKLHGAYASVKAAYCNDKYIVILSDGSPSWNHNLQDVYVPPGSTDGSGACVTRSSNPQFVSFKIPLNPVPLSTSTRSNNMGNFPQGAADAVGGYMNGINGGYGLPTRGAIAVSVTGQEIFPFYNNRATLTGESCEVDSCNEHVGGGGGQPHLHGDPFGEWCLYSAKNYSSLDAHPPQIGWSLDGYPILGRYLSENAPGYNVTLDDCGGHVHGTYSYHYHAQVISAVTDADVAKNSMTNQPVVSSGTVYAAFSPGVYQCWKGDISTIPNFFTPVDEDVAPCCGMQNFWSSQGILINGVGTQNLTGGVPPQTGFALDGSSQIHKAIHIGYFLFMCFMYL